MNKDVHLQIMVPQHVYQAFFNARQRPLQRPREPIEADRHWTFGAILELSVLEDPPTKVGANVNRKAGKDHESSQGTPRHASKHVSSPREASFAGHPPR